MKTCIACNLEKADSNFYSRKDGRLSSRCINCDKIQKAEWRRNNLKYFVEYSKTNQEELKKKQKSFYDEHKLEIRKYAKQKRNSNKETINTRRREQYKLNPEKFKKRAIEARKRNIVNAKAYERSEKRRSSRRRRNVLYAKKNPGIMNYRKALRKARKLRATPAWANLDKIKEIYKNCPKGYQVDHIVPLVAKNKNGIQIASGLHVENNLQYLTAFENAQKNCYFEPTIVAYQQGE